LTDDGTITAQVSELIRACIHSLEELEVLLLLRSGGARGWSASQIASELQIVEPLALDALRALMEHELAGRVGTTTPPQFRYLAQDPERERAIEELARTCTHNRIPVLMRISSNAIERVRKGALRTFSDAFRGPGRKLDD
jgi:hypothetical protein